MAAALMALPVPAPAVEKDRAPSAHYTAETRMDQRSFSHGRGLSIVSPLGHKSLDKALDYVEAHPRDTQMIRHTKGLVKTASTSQVRSILERFRRRPSTALAGLLFHAPGNKHPYLVEALAEITKSLGKDKTLEFFYDAADLDTRSMTLGQHLEMGARWKELLALSREQHAPVTTPALVELPVPQDVLLSAIEPKEVVAVSAFAGPHQGSPHADVTHHTGTSIRETSPAQTVERAERALDGVLPEEGQLYGYGYAGTYMLGLDWKLDLRVALDRADLRVTGTAQSGGKGLDHDQATASALMETVERWSAGAGVGPHWPKGYTHDLGMRRARLSELKAEGQNALDPNDLNLPIPYVKEDIYWVGATERTQDGDKRILVPSQAVFLHSNLDEHDIMDGSSNGLASGNTPSEARLHALLEIIERDGDYTMFYQPNRVFRISEASGAVGEILERLAGKGLHNVQFFDMTTELGIPTYRAFVKDGQQVISGSGTHLDGKIALVRALCELNPKLMVYESEKRSWQDVEDPPDSQRVTPLHALPNYSSGHVETDLGITERTLIANGHRPIYADLTREEMQIPVVRAIVPGLDIPESPSRRQIARFLADHKDFWVSTQR